MLRVGWAIDWFFGRVVASFVIEHGLMPADSFEEDTRALLAADDLYCPEHGQRECANCLDSGSPSLRD